MLIFPHYSYHILNARHCLSSPYVNNSSPRLTSPPLTSHLCLPSVYSPTNTYSEHPLRIYHPSLLPSSILPVSAGCPQWEVVRANQVLVGGGGGDGIGWTKQPPRNQVGLASPQCWGRREVVPKQTDSPVRLLPTTHLSIGEKWGQNKTRFARLKMEHVATSQQALPAVY